VVDLCTPRLTTSSVARNMHRRTTGQRAITALERT